MISKNEMNKKYFKITYCFSSSKINEKQNNLSVFNRTKLLLTKLANTYLPNKTASFK